MTTAEGSRLARLIPLWILLAVPLAVLKPANDYVLQPKVAVAMGAAALFVTALFLTGPAALLGHLRRQPLLAPVAGVVALAFCSVPAAVNLPQAGRLAVEQMGWAALALGATAAGVGLERVLAVCAVGVAAMLWISLDQLGGRWYVGHGDQFGPGRIYATLGNPSFFGVFLAPLAVWFAVGGLAAARAGRVLAAAALGMALAITLFLMMKAAVIDAWAGLAVGAAVGVWLMLAAEHRGTLLRPTVYAVLVLAAGALAAAWVLAPYLHDRLGYLKVKAFSWHAAAWLWRDHPLLGAGPGGFQTEAPLVMTRVHALWTTTWGVPRSYVAPHDEAFAHQDYLQLLAETGVAGCGAWVWMVVVACRAGWRALLADGRAAWDRIAWIAGLAAFLPTMALHFPLHLAPPLAVFWLSIGWAGASPSRAQRGGGRKEVPGSRFEDVPGSRAARRWVMGWAVAALLTCVFIARGLTCNVLLGEGYRFFRGGAPHLAAPFFERFERLSARNYEERFYAGAMYQALRDEPRAIDAYERAIALYPGMQGALYNLGNVYFHRGDYAQAAAAYARVLAINPEQEDALNNLGNCHGVLGHHAEAERSYLEVIALNPAHVDALYNLAVNAYRLKHYRDSRRWLARTQAANPGYPAARELAGLLRDAPR